MDRAKKVLALSAVLATLLVAVFANGPVALAGTGGGYTDRFFLGDCDFTSRGSNRFFILEPNYRLILKGEEKDGAQVEVVITVLSKTKVVDGVQTRVVEERESHDGELVEVSRNYFAFCKQTNSLFYYGEAVDIYENGQIVSHEGAWQSGKNGARAGLFMPGIVLLGARYQEETAPGVAMDRGEIVSLTEEVETAAGDFDNVLKIRETTPLEPGVVEFKYWAPGVGLVQDGDLKLEEYGFI
jgi:hypothetical protein